MPGRSQSGVTLVEVLLAVVILSIGMLSFMMAFSYTARSIQKSKTRLLSSTPLTMEKLELLKNISYQRLMVSTDVVAAAESGFNFLYDRSAYPSESVRVGDINFIRRVLIRKMRNVGGTFTEIPATDPDTGIKLIRAYTIWEENGQWKKFEASSLYSDPDLVLLGSTLRGNVKDSGGLNLQDVEVIPLQAPSYSGRTGSSGNYGFQVISGDFTLRAKKFGYYTAYSGLRSVPSGSVVTTNFDGTDAPALVPIASGTLAGTVWMSSNVLISQVVASTGAGPFGEENEYVELYNPTTYTWTINASSFKLMYREKNVGGVMEEIAITFANTSLPANRYYLIASTTSITVNGIAKTADAYYSIQANRIADSADGGIGIRRDATSPFWDRVAWARSGGPNPPVELIETIPISLEPAVGLADGAQIVRLTSTGTTDSSYGNAYDTDINSVNFSTFSSIAHYPRNSSDSRTPISGFPARLAVASANDGLSSAVQAAVYNAGTNSEYAAFSLPGVATGTWKLALTSGTLHLMLSTVSVPTGAQTYFVPNAATDPAWPAAGYNVARLSSTIVSGFISGTVRKTDSSPLSGITVKSGTVGALTAANGTYTLSLATGTQTVTANPDGDPGYSANYVSVSSAGWPVETGKVTTGVDFTLSEGGGIMGWFTANGVDPLSNIPVISTQSGVQMGSAVSGSDGHFRITNLAKGAYTVIPQLDTGESSSPVNKNATISSAGQTVWSATFTVSGALGYFSGSVTKSGQAITTGALIVASTGTIAGSNPPADDSSLRNSGVLYYAGSSKPDGTYELPVRGGAGTYNIYGWYTTVSGQTPTTVKISMTGTVAAGQTQTVNLAW
ncbi:MAG: prepilin-type N-terminal cleavage/methylation domain-containing protein [Elusimicrobia bacterium]|nr:prepilin-type N-terminal cleavage/methylation domain-containing protein [Elusimicrobiota bacterium]